MNEGWDTYAEEFNNLASFDNQNIHTGLGLKGIDPNSVVGDANSIIDIGCGDGTNTYLMYKIRNVRTVGIDIAAYAINKANEKYATGMCSFKKCDLTSFIKQYDDNPFELVTFWGSIDYLRIDKFFFEELNQITRIGSRCFISKFHPMWTTLYGNDVDDLVMKSYFDEGRVDFVPYGECSRVILKRIHYSISYIFTIFDENGWNLKLLQEPKPNVEDASFKYRNYDSDDKLMERMSNVPMTVILEFERMR